MGRISGRLARRLQKARRLREQLRRAASDSAVDTPEGVKSVQQLVDEEVE